MFRPSVTQEWVDEGSGLAALGLGSDDVVGTRRKIAGSLPKVIEGLLGARRMLVEGDGGLVVSSLKVIKSLSGVRGSSSKYRRWAVVVSPRRRWYLPGDGSIIVAPVFRMLSAIVLLVPALVLPIP
ncbi:hypothetical protein BHE74_00036465 [Ensete ventricosum]|nr:hypothetical protein GW17_00047560 [Ensete ventricosum]RWW56794.1 hypothetical protein BHE74_00036465 [Ensete ventricosum]RZS05938.1 hypothetical protein BHM03_00036510 [Ensete ventricosum]